MRVGLAVVLACAHGRTPLAPSVPRPLSERADPLVAAADHAQRALLGLLGMDRDDAALVDQCAARAARLAALVDAAEVEAAVELAFALTTRARAALPPACARHLERRYDGLRCRGRRG